MLNAIPRVDRDEHGGIDTALRHVLWSLADAVIEQLSETGLGVPHGPAFYVNERLSQ
jgi:hypothetical protein